MKSKMLLCGAAIAGAVCLGTPAAFGSACIGTCGSLGADGVVTLSPTGNSTYGYISTYQGSTGAGEISGVGGTDGSQFTTDLFAAKAGDPLTFYFNYVTSDGTSKYTDYAWAELVDSSNNHVAWLFTARTQPVGDTSPGFGLPTNDSTLTPASTPIIPPGPAWSPLGTSSGACYEGPGQGCGYTDWIESTYTIAAAGDYMVRYGVTNIGDDEYDSGLAFDGLAVAGVPVGNGPGVPEPSTWALLLAGLGTLLFGIRRRRSAS